MVKTDKVRADTTVVSANVAYPTDSGLLVKAIVLITTLVARIHAAGAASRTGVRDRRRAAGRRARSISAHLTLRNDEAKASVLRLTGELTDLVEVTVGEATRVLVNARRHVARQGAAASGWLASAVDDLQVVLGRATQVIAQTRTRLGGATPASATRLVSLHDVDARPIAKGRLGKPVEFGYKAQVVDNTDGIMLDHGVHRGNPTDAPLLVPAVTRIKTLLGRAPKAVTADRGYGEAKIDDELTDLGVTTVVIPRKGKPSQARRGTEHGRSFRRLVKWRTGCEGRISYLKRRYGFDRTLLDGLDGARTWCGLGVLAHNTVKIAHLIDARPPTRHAKVRTSTSRPARARASRAAGTGPPANSPPRGTAG